MFFPWMRYCFREKLIILTGLRVGISADQRFPSLLICLKKTEKDNLAF